MSPTAPSPYPGIEDELRAAFHAAAAAIDANERTCRVDASREEPLPDAVVVVLPAATSGRVRRRWVVPAVAAAVVIAVGAPIVALTVAKSNAGPDISAASAVTITGEGATIAGITFPVPAGWSVSVVGHDDTSVTACVAARLAANCDGVTMRIAVPTARGRITPVPDPVRVAETTWCPDAHTTTSLYIQIVDQPRLNGGPAYHYQITCGSTGPMSTGYSISDGSLTITTPPGIAASQAASIAAGLDFSGYRHRFGPQISFISPMHGPGAGATSALPAPTR